MKSPLTLLLIFVGVFLLVMIAIAGITSMNQNNNTNTTETQDVQSEQINQSIEYTKPFIIGLGGFQMLLLVVLIFGGIGTFILLITKSFRRRRW